MKCYTYFFLTLGFMQSIDLRGQGTFRNLDFEQSQIPQTQPPGQVAASLALPFWTVYYGSAQQSQVAWNEFSVGSPQVSLYGPGSIMAPMDGGYSVSIFGSVTGASISQVGLVPSNARSVVFKAQIPPNEQAGVSISVGGVTLPLFEVFNGPNYILYEANVTPFAGLQEELRFSAAWNGVGPSYWNIDDIVFSTAAVPEPSALSLFMIGPLFIGVVWRWRKA